MTPPVILVDMGNTGVSLALARGTRLSRKRRLATGGLSRRVVAETLRDMVTGRRLGGSILCSVVPRLNNLWTRELAALTGSDPLLLHHGLNAGIEIAVPKPAELGADRIANACAVAHWHGTPAIVVDFGTALTFDVVSKNNEYIGGVIAPGLPFMMDYFVERTALLPRIAWEKAARARQGLAFGRNTVEAMIAGAEAGYLGMVKEIVKRLKRQLKSRRTAICATGGYADWILAGSGLDITIDHDLTLRGINRIYELNT